MGKLGHVRGVEKRQRRAKGLASVLLVQFDQTLESHAVTGRGLRGSNLLEDAFDGSEEICREHEPGCLEQRILVGMNLQKPKTTADHVGIAAKDSVRARFGSKVHGQSFVENSHKS